MEERFLLFLLRERSNLLGLYPYPKLSKKFLGQRRGEERKKRRKRSNDLRQAPNPEFNDSFNQSFPDFVSARKRESKMKREGEGENARYFGVGRG